MAERTGSARGRNETKGMKLTKATKEPHKVTSLDVGEPPEVFAFASGDLEADKRIKLPPYETIALMLQGGGTLGAYQAGVYQGLNEAGIHPNWIAGISIGALNTAIIAENAPENCVPCLLEFWETICQPAFMPPLPAFIEHAFFNSTDEIRKAFTAMQAVSALVEERRGFFIPRFPPLSPLAAGGAWHGEFLWHTAAEGHARTVLRFRPDQLA